MLDTSRPMEMPEKMTHTGNGDVIVGLCGENGIVPMSATKPTSSAGSLSHPLSTSDTYDSPGLNSSSTIAEVLACSVNNLTIGGTPTLYLVSDTKSKLVTTTEK